MGRPKKVKPDQQKRDPNVESVYETEVTFTCPIRGLVTQKVKVKRYKPPAEHRSGHLQVPIDELIEKLDEKDDGLAIYNDGEDVQ